MAQKFMTYEQQLNKLQVDKGLSIPDADFAQKTLEEISYYSLIGGYKGLFLHPASKKYKYGVTFDEIVAFYHFDSLFLAQRQSRGTHNITKCRSPLGSDDSHRKKVSVKRITRFWIQHVVVFLPSASKYLS